MAEDKYKIKIVRTGIGDPFLLGEFYFDTENGLNPANTPCEGLQIAVEFQDEDGGFHHFGSITVTSTVNNWAKSMGLDTNYHFGLPFDPGSGYIVGNTVTMKLTFTTGNYPVALDDGSNDHSTYVMEYDPSGQFGVQAPCYYQWEAS